MTLTQRWLLLSTSRFEQFRLLFQIFKRTQAEYGFCTIQIANMIKFTFELIQSADDTSIFPQLTSFAAQARPNVHNCFLLQLFKPITCMVISENLVLYRFTNWLMSLCGQIQSPRPDVMPDRGPRAL